MDDVKERIKKHEGFRDTVYADSLGKSTIGYGHLVLSTDHFVEGQQYPKETLEELFDLDFNEALQSADDLLQGLEEISQDARGVICEMCFQLGKPRTMKFKRMWEGIRSGNFDKAADEMLDSNWNKQTPGRCKDLADIMRGCNK